MISNAYSSWRRAQWRENCLAICVLEMIAAVRRWNRQATRQDCVIVSDM
jgi:hypothetical protein